MLPKIKPAKKTIYLDHAATTYLDKRVEKAMRPFWYKRYGNPSSLYKKGREAAEAVTEARSSIAKILSARPSEIIFAAGGTESVNLAIFGVARSYELAHKKKGHLVASKIEHYAVLNSLAALKEEGWATSLIDVDDQGFVDLKQLKAAVRKDTVLISVMYANNEIGAVQPIAEIGKWLRGLNIERAAKKLTRLYFHTDACQAAGSLEVDANRLGVDLMSINGSKIYGPKQTGFLYVKTGTPLRPLIFGGGQEKNLRSGTENVAGAVGLATALQLAQKDRVKENRRLQTLRDYFLKQLFKKNPQIKLNGSLHQRLPNNINISIIGVEGEALMLYLDSYNIAVSTGSACTTTSTDPSHVLIALGRTAHDAYSSVRFTLGRETTKADVDYVLKVLPGLVQELRRL
jgi:cysteine desulfurase